MQAVWTFVLEHRDVIGWLAGGAATLATGAWAVVTYLWPRHAGSGSPDRAVAVGGSVRDSTITNTINQENPTTLKLLVEAAEQKGRLEQELQVTKGALLRLFKEMGEGDVPADEIPDKINWARKRFLELRSLVVQMPAATPEGAAVKRQAAVDLDAGEYERVERLLSAVREQTRADELRHAGQPDQVLAALKEAQRYFSDPSVGNTTGAVLQRAYNYKTQAQIYASKGDTALADRALASAFDAFHRIKSGDPGTTSVAEFASALNGIGTVYQEQGDFKKAIGVYEQALSVLPGYAYAWHDLLIAYVALARTGEIKAKAMHHALGKLKETGRGLPGLHDSYLEMLGQTVARFDKERRSR